MRPRSSNRPAGIPASARSPLRFLVLALLAPGLLGGCAVAPPPEVEAIAPPTGRWAREMAAFEAQDLAAPTAPGGVLFVGSSSIRLWDLEASFPGLHALNRGFGGSEMSDSVEHLDLLVLRHQPEVVVLYAGDNDVNGGKSAERVAADFDAFLGRLRRALPETALVYISIKPSTSRWKLYPIMRDANARIRARCEADGRSVFLDVEPLLLGPDGTPRVELLREDGLHLNAEGYRAWTAALTAALRQLPSKGALGRWLAGQPAAST